jgi:hypothetical protein
MRLLNRERTGQREHRIQSGGAPPHSKTSRQRRGVRQCSGAFRRGTRAGDGTPLGQSANTTPSPKRRSTAALQNLAVALWSAPVLWRFSKVKRLIAKPELGIAGEHSRPGCRSVRPRAEAFAQRTPENGSVARSQEPTTRASSAAPGAGALPICKWLSAGDFALSIRADTLQRLTFSNRCPILFLWDTHWPKSNRRSSSAW